MATTSKYATTIKDYLKPWDWKQDYYFQKMVEERRYQQIRTKHLAKNPDSTLSDDSTNPFGATPTHLFVRTIMNDGKLFATRIQLKRYSNSYWNSFLKHRHIYAVPESSFRYSNGMGNDAGFQFMCYMRLHVTDYPHAPLYETELVPDPLTAVPLPSDFVWTFDYRKCSYPVSS